MIETTELRKILKNFPTKKIWEENGSGTDAK